MCFFSVCLYVKFRCELTDIMLWLLAGEIDRCLKKVQEGVEAFEEIWKKVFLTALQCYVFLMD